MMLVAGVDSSTQSCKVVICDLQSGLIVRSGRASHPTGTEVDPAAWWQALHAAIIDAGGLDDVAAVSIGGQQHGLVALDGAGRVIRPALLWNDTRSAAAAADLRSEVGAGEFAERTGSVPVASFTITKLRWLADAEPQNAERVAAVALPHDWLTWRLRGFGPASEVGENPSGPQLDELVTDRSDASGTGYFDSVRNEYDRGLLRLALRRDVSDVALPMVLSPAQSRGIPIGIPTFPSHLRVAAGAGDNAAAAFGLGANTGDVVVSIGTSGTVFAVTDTPAHDAIGTVAGFADAAGVFLPLVATLNAARILDAIATLLGVDHTEFGDLALSAEPGADGLVLVPYFEGERTPNLPNATGSLLGLTLASATPPNLARAAVEGLLCGLAAGLDAITAHGVVAQRLLVIGGGAQNPAVAAIAAQVFDLPVVIPEPAEYVAVGAARQAAWALTGEKPRWPVAVVTQPTPDFRAVIRAQYAAALA